MAGHQHSVPGVVTMQRWRFKLDFEADEVIVVVISWDQDIPREGSKMVKPPVQVESIDPELLELIGEEHQAWRNALPVEELARYGGKYIATRKKQIVAASESLEELYRQLESLELRGRCLIEYIEEPDVVVIY